MVIWRSEVFPTLMVLVFSVIAPSLAKMAFFSSEQQNAVSPGAAVTDPVVLVETATIVNHLSLQVKVMRDAECQASRYLYRFSDLLGALATAVCSLPGRPSSPSSSRTAAAKTSPPLNRAGSGVSSSLLAKTCPRIAGSALQRRRR